MHGEPRRYRCFAVHVRRGAMHLSSHQQLLCCVLPGPLQIKLGTLDQPHAENEFILRSYVNSAKRSKLAAPEEEEQQ
jgi:hypothetical protein